MVAVIIGATGLVGSHLLNKLLADTAFSKVISLGRRSSGVQNLKLQELLISDLSEMLKFSNELKGDLYFCCLGTTIKAAGSREAFKKIDYQCVSNFAEIAKAHHAKCFALVSAAGASAKSLIFYNQVKGDIENFVRELKFRRLVILRPSLLIGERKSFRLVERVAVIAAESLAPLLSNKMRKKIMSRADQVADRLLQESKAAADGVVVLNAEQI